MSEPRIKVLCKVYNEAFLLPFFLQHYSFAHQIHALVTPSTDDSLAVLRSASWAHLDIIDEEVLCPDGIDDRLLVDRMNKVLAEPTKDFDWAIVVDVDEFIWPYDGLGVDLPIDRKRVQRFLSQIPAHDSIVHAQMYQVYRHKTDRDLDFNLPPAPQRRHGDPDLKAKGGGYTKPSVLRLNHGLQVTPGHHSVLPNPRASVAWPVFEGAHWTMADSCFCITRRCRDRRDRISASNRKNRHGFEVFTVKEQELMDFCRRMEDSPRVF